jgi:MATE family multidrug resistance protein
MLCSTDHSTGSIPLRILGLPVVAEFIVALCRTPLISAALSNVANFTMDIIFIFVFGWGVAGAALATSASQYVGMAAMLYLLNRKHILNFADLRHVPSISEIAPLLRVRPMFPCALLMPCST